MILIFRANAMAHTLCMLMCKMWGRIRMYDETWNNWSTWIQFKTLGTLLAWKIGRERNQINWTTSTTLSNFFINKLCDWASFCNEPGSHEIASCLFVRSSLCGGFCASKIHDILFVCRVISRHLQDKSREQKQGVQTKNNPGWSLKREECGHEIISTTVSAWSLCVALVLYELQTFIYLHYYFSLYLYL